MLTDERGTTNLTVADRWGNVVEYTLTIEQTGGNAMVVPGRGFLLNNADRLQLHRHVAPHLIELTHRQAAAQFDGADNPA